MDKEQTLNENELCSERAESEDVGAMLIELAKELLEDEDFIEKYVVGNKTVERAVINNYLRSFGRTTPTMPLGTAALSPLSRPKTLEEARTVAMKYLKEL